MAVLIASHFGLFALAFLVLHQQPQSDLPAAYVPEAHWVMSGKVPYRDFISSYAPLNPYLHALVLKIKDSPLSLVVFQILCDVASVPFWIGFLRRFMPEVAVRRAAILYILQPLVLWEICLNGKNHGCITLLLAISMYYIGGCETVSGISYGLSLVLVKILPSIFMPTLALGARRRTLWILSALVFPILVYGGFYLAGLDITVPVRLEGSKSTPNNLPYLLESLTGWNLPTVLVSVFTLLIVIAALAYSGWMQLKAPSSQARLRAVSWSTLFVLFALLIANKKAFTSYLEMCFFLICALTAWHVELKRRSVAWFYCILSLVALPVTSFWYSPLNMPTAVELHSLWVAGNRDALVEMGLQVLLLIALLGLGVRIARDLFEAGSAEAPLLTGSEAHPPIAG